MMTEVLIGRLIHTPTHKQYCDSLTDVEETIPIVFDDDEKKQNGL